MRGLDHLIWAVPDLDSGIAALEALSGVQAKRGGSHPGRGTRNALISLGPTTYLEILAPDPGQALDGTFGAGIAKLGAPRLLGYMLGSSALDAAKAAFDAAGVTANGPFAAERKVGDGSVLRWRLLIPETSPWGESTPMLIDWGQTPNPALSAPGGCAIERFEIGHPQAEGLQALIETLGGDIAVLPADRAYMLAGLAGPKGRFVLTGFGSLA
ncbi:MAG: VOC family protein [Rhodospirillaceae bacterium]|nr:VOC family protein [Rhodospirillaceae bacterium]